MKDHTIEDLERALRGADGAGRPDLATIHRRGRRRRGGRSVLCAGATLVCVGALAVGVSATVGGTDRASDSTLIVSRPVAPRELPALARRALAEIPGAVQVSAGEVVIPVPAGGTDVAEPVPDKALETGPVDIGAHNFADVSWFDPSAFPTWLYDGVQDLEGRDSGVLVDDGSLGLACMRPLPEWDESDTRCRPAMIGGTEGARTRQWGMGADGFLEPGAPLQLFTARGVDPRNTVWIGGVDGTDVATVDLVAADGAVTHGTVAAGTVVPGDTMFWGTVSGDLAQVVTRDAHGSVLERHRIHPCSGGVDCEVR